MELARAYGKQPKPARSVVFLAVTAEEKGLLGSEYYAANPLYPLAKTAGVINMDGVAPNGPARDFSISGVAKLDLLDRLTAQASKWQRTYSPDPNPEAGGQDWEKGGLTAGKANAEAYRINDYHQPSDEFRPEWTFTGAVRDVELMYATGRELADSGDWPNWSQDSEFRAARDESAAERK